VRIAAVAHPLALGTVDNVSADAEIFIGPQHDVVNIVQQFIGGLKSSGTLIVGSHEITANVS